jgi:hypothetical protein
MEQPKRPLWARPTAVAAAALLLTAAVHVPTFRAYVFADDVQWIMGGRAFRFGQLFELGWRNHFFRPMVELYFALLGRLLGDAPVVFHAANLALHVVNALLVWRLGRTLGATREAAALGAVIFAAHTRGVASAAWISGVTAVLSTTFILAALIAHVEAVRTGRRALQIASVAAFAAALLTHETSVVLAPLLLGAEAAAGLAPGQRERPRSRWIPHAVALLLLAGFLAIALRINRRNYVVTEGHYRLGLHVFGNLLRYLDALYVGRAEGAGLVLTALAYAALALVRSAVIRFGLAATVLTLIPCSFFTWGGTMRYLYLPSAFFSLAVAEAIVRLGQWLGRGTAGRLKAAAVGVLALALIARFAFFGAKAARDSWRVAEGYRDYVAAFASAHPDLPAGATVTVPPPGRGEPDDIYIETLLQWARNDPGLRVRFAR